ncbi:PDR/VanB family oxidoreductase [Shewanella sp. C32]|uniref:PDR/VanB family oxidoreductase n=1 Tax=Shewanella electrica TaxID=515560 RepID=A0ABT2FKB4_9GAMM|nr:PDR/VanB family oxidoreductase [Shewanella electrica]MCH1924207.1 PDR/VanB family oxidoreductase [Shewanella electrica]MCS4556110.1 PDR/VanB family oxidoreductase [Shewanella electrica]
MNTTITKDATSDIAPATKFSLQLTVTDKAAIADGIVKLQLTGDDLPPWEPGAHLELALPDGLVRAYSIVAGTTGRSYELAILLEPNSRGGSRYLHEQLSIGDVINATPPKNAFALAPATRYVFIAGGIGITPILPMIARLKNEGKSWQLYYLGRSRARMAYLADIQALADEAASSVSLHIKDEGCRLELATLVSALADDTAVYSCGPNSLMDALSAEITRRPALHLYMERFGRAELPAAAPVDVTDCDDEATQATCNPDGSFELELSKSGETITVGKDETILECVRKVRQGLSFSCSDGYCGTCETAVLAGTPEHRDSVLSEEEKQENRTMMICVSRSKTRKLVLDL